VTAPGWY